MHRSTVIPLRLPRRDGSRSNYALGPEIRVHFQWLWHSLKDKEVHLKAYAKMSSRASASAKSFRFYNKRRLHQALSYPTPEAAR